MKAKGRRVLEYTATEVETAMENMRERHRAELAEVYKRRYEEGCEAGAKAKLHEILTALGLSDIARWAPGIGPYGSTR